MVTSVKELHGTVGIFFNSVLGSGTYGKVCKAKCGLLPCVAKVFHDSLFLPESSSEEKVLKLEQECKNLTTIRHPNLAQYLGTAMDPKTKRPLLFMEVLDESLTEFLRNSSEAPPYHLQVKLGHDVCLGLAYLHFNSLIHGTLTSNNVLVIGEASRAKLTDFGLFKFVDAYNLAIASSGVVPFMAPETLAHPPIRSSQADCFSYGVVLLQILTSDFPKPTKAFKTVDGREVKVAEVDRREKDISCVDTSHHLLPIVLKCLKDKDTERSSADKMCDRIALLKRRTIYQNSEQLYFTTLEELQKTLQRKEKLLEKCNLQVQMMKEKHEKELEKLRNGKENGIERTHTETEKYIQSDERIDNGDTAVRETEERDLQNGVALKQRKITPISHMDLVLPRPGHDLELAALDERKQREQVATEASSSPSQDRSHTVSISSCDPGDISCETSNVSYESLEDPSTAEDHTPSEDEQWSRRSPAPETMGSLYGAAVVHGSTAYFSKHYNIYSYKLAWDKWSKLKPCTYQSFSLIVIDDRVTTIGGITRDLKRTKNLFSLSNGHWKKFYPPMLTHRVCAAAFTTPTHLVVIGGRNKVELQCIEVMDRATQEWCSASCGLPESMGHPQMALQNGHLYVCNYQTTYAAPVKDLLQSCVEKYENLSSIWKRFPDLPLHMDGASLVTVEERVVAVGGYGSNNRATGDICYYNSRSDSWKVVNKMSMPRGDALTALLPGDLLLIVGGWSELQFYDVTDVVRLNLTKIDSVPRGHTATS